jgi:hypothetical protein
MSITRFFVPTTGPDDWRRLLADPEKHWRAGFSAHALAHCWEQARGFPSEVAELFAQSAIPAFERLEFLLAFPEYQVPLPGGGYPSQNDLFVLAKGGDGQLAAIMVEGKVEEPFGPTVGEWQAAASAGKQKRLAFIKTLLGPDDLPPIIRYQLLHRTASAMIEARRFNARSAVLLVHSFSPDAAWFGDFQAFLGLFGVQAQHNQLHWLREAQGINLYAGWVQGR